MSKAETVILIPSASCNNIYFITCMKHKGKAGTGKIQIQILKINYILKIIWFPCDCQLIRWNCG